MTVREPALPVFLLLKDRRCLVVGSAPAAQMRVLALVEAGAHVRVVSLDPSPAIASSPCVVINRTFETPDLDGVFFAVAASRDPNENAEVALECQRRDIPVNVVDDRGASSVIFPAVVRRGPITVAVSSNGTSPAVATYLRDSIAPLLSEDFERMATLVDQVRTAIHASNSSTEGLPWHQLIAELLGALAAQDEHGIERILREFLAGAAPVEPG